MFLSSLAFLLFGALQDAGAFEIRCRDPEGKGVAGVEVHVFQHDRLKEPSSYRPFGPFTTDEQGVAVCPEKLEQDGASDTWVYARVPDKLVGVARRMDGAFMLTPPPEGVDVVMMPSTPVKGVVTVPDGYSAEGVHIRTITVSIFDGKRMHEGRDFGSTFTRQDGFRGLDTCLAQVFECDTDSDGRFELRDFPIASRFTLVAEAEGLALTQYNHGLRRGPGNPPPSANPIEVSLRLDVEGIIEGWVLNEQGEPMEGVEVTARIEPTRRVRGFGYLYTFRATSNAIGRFRIVGLPDADYAFRAEDPSGKTVMLPRFPYTVKPFELHGGEEIVMLRGILVSGRVLDEKTGEGVEGANLGAVMSRRLGARPGVGHTRSGPEGYYTLRLPPGAIDLYFSGVPKEFTYPDPQIVKTLELTADTEDMTGLDFKLPRR